VENPGCGGYGWEEDAKKFPECDAHGSDGTGLNDKENCPPARGIIAASSP